MMEMLKSRFTPGTAEDVNFYFEDDRMAVSDNHRMAYWFFRNNTAEGSTLIQVDTHPDCSLFRDSALAHLRDVEPHDCAQQFADDRYDSLHGQTPPVQYGNWIPALLVAHPALFTRVRLLCHKPPGSVVLSDLPQVEEIDEESLTDDLQGYRSCLSIHVDYYFTEHDGTYTQRETNPAPLGHFRRLLATALLNPQVLVFVALSPQCCGGWQNVLPFVRCLDEELGLGLAQEITGRLEQRSPGDG